MRPATTRTAAAAAPTDVVAVAAGRVLHARHVDERQARIRQEAGTDNLPADGSPEARRLRRWIVHTLVEEAIVEAEAVAMGETARDAPSAPLDDAVVRQVFEAVTADVVVPDDEVTRYYEHNLARFRQPERWTVLQAIVTDRATARSLTTAARTMGLAAAAARSSPRPPVERLQVARGRRGAGFDAALSGTAAGAVVAAAAGPLGWAVVEVIEARPATTTPLSAVRDAIASDLLAGHRGRCFDLWLAAQRRGQVRLLPGSEHPGDPRVPDSMHRH